MMEIRYVNASGNAITLNRGAYLVAENDLRDFEWEAKITNRPSGYGGRVTFGRSVQRKHISVGIRGRGEFEKNAKALLALTEPDILNNTPGKLYLGEQYLICYLAVASHVNYYARRSDWVSKDLDILVVEPFWREDIVHRFLPGSSTTIADGKKYNLRYEYRYAPSAAGGSIDIDHYAPSPMIITIYGPVTNPTITIGTKIYRVNASISATQRLVIDQLRRTIVSISPDGTQTNLFDYRDKTNDIFTPLDPGENNVVYSGAFAFDVIAVAQRSEPAWT